MARFGPTGVDLSLAAALRFPGGVLGLIDCSFEQPFRCVYELVGTRGVIEVPDAYLPPARPTARLRAADSAQDLVFDGHEPVRRDGRRLRRWRSPTARIASPTRPRTAWPR